MHRIDAAPVALALDEDMEAEETSKTEANAKIKMILVPTKDGDGRPTKPKPHRVGVEERLMRNKNNHQIPMPSLVIQATSSE